VASRSNQVSAGQGAALVRAAGGVVCRSKGAGPVEVALIRHRGSRDWALPKGKLDQGETPEQAALREVKEETGLRCQLLRDLGCSYFVDRRGRQKVVCFWLMRRLAGRFRPSDEVTDLRWLGFAEAVALVANERDRAVLSRAQILGTVSGAWPVLDAVRTSA
jgi:8-oxo-dGTP pyrophosphatase MutT (NUDIX family)